MCISAFFRLLHCDAYFCFMGEHLLNLSVSVCVTLCVCVCVYFYRVYAVKARVIPGCTHIYSRFCIYVLMACSSCYGTEQFLRMMLITILASVCKMYLNVHIVMLQCTPNSHPSAQNVERIERAQLPVRILSRVRSGQNMLIRFARIFFQQCGA